MLGVGGGGGGMQNGRWGQVGEGMQTLWEVSGIKCAVEVELTVVEEGQGEVWKEKGECRMGEGVKWMRPCRHCVCVAVVVVVVGGGGGGGGFQE